MGILKDFLLQHNIPEDSRFLAAFSGGGDSVFMVLSFIEEGLSFSCAYFQHNIREDSKEEEIFVKNFCEKYGIKLYMGERKNNWNSSIEEKAREERYAFFYEIMNKYNYDYLVLSHNKEDVVETFFINLLRSSGITGLASIKEFDEKKRIIRPFLNLEREYMRKYLMDRNVKWYDDPTNEEEIFFRNKIRHRLLPVLKEIKSDAVDMVFETTRNLQEYIKITDKLKEKMILHLPDGGIYLDCKDILAYNNYSIIYALLGDLRLGKHFYKRMFELCLKEDHSKLYMKGKEVIKGRYGLYIKGENYNVERKSLKNVRDWFGWKIFIDKIGSYEKDKYEKYLYIGDIEGLYIDRIKDIEVKTFSGKKKRLKDVFTDKKIDHIWMDYLPGIYCNDELVYVPGVFRSDFLPCRENCYKIGVYNDAYQRILKRREDSEKN